MNLRHLNVRQRGFIIFFGWRTVIGKDGSPSLETECSSCHQQTALLGKQHRRWFTLFFIPVIPLSSPTRFAECSRCHAQFRLNVDEMRQHLAADEQRRRQEATTLHNSLIAASKNSVALQQLMLIHASLGEYDQAIAEARQFPDALNGSEQCMTTLGRVCLARNEHATAIEWFDAVIARNADLAEPHYFKAITLLNQTPPNTDAAIAEARRARALNYPNADQLLRHAESQSQNLPIARTGSPALPQQNPST